MPNWQGYFNEVTFYGGWLLFFALLLASYARWRWNQGAQHY